MASPIGRRSQSGQISVTTQPSGTPIVAVADGTITKTGYDGSYGNKTVETLKDGTEIWYCHQSVFSVQPGDRIRGGHRIGSIGATGNVTDVERSGRVSGRAHLSFAFSEANIRGDREDLKTNPLTFEAEATKGEDATKVGAGAVGGAILGGILGGKKGAAKGAIAGGAAGTGVVLATKGKEVTVNEGTDVTATLAQPMTLRVRVR